MFVADGRVACSIFTGKVIRQLLIWVCHVLRRPFVFYLKEKVKRSGGKKREREAA